MDYLGVVSMEGEPSEPVSGNLSQEQKESRDEMLARHRKEISQLQKKEIELKKAAAKGSKAKQKAKKKQVEEEIAGYSAELKETHAKKLASLGYNTNSNMSEKNNLDSLVEAIAGMPAASQPDQAKVSKAKQRKDERAQREVEREKRIEAEQNDMISDRMIENEKLQKKIEPLGLTVNEIKPDGHSLYRAVEDQLAVLSGGSLPYTYQELREMAAAYMSRTSSHSFHRRIL